MKEFLTKLLNQINGIVKKLNNKQKLIFAAIILIVFISLIFLVSYSGKSSQELLYPGLNAKDFGEITKKLQEWKYPFSPRDTEIWVSPKDKQQIKMKLLQENIIPEGTKGWDLFDTQKWTTTDFERNINLRRAVIGEITKHLKALKDDIEDVSISITMPAKELYIDEDEPWKASVILTPAPYSDITKNKKKIKGIVTAIAFGIDKLKPENVRILDNYGNLISDFSEEDEQGYLTRAKEEAKIIENLKNKLQNDIYTGLGKVIGKDNVDVRVFLDVDFNQEESERKELLPTEIKKDNPNTPYDESQTVEKIIRSKKSTSEKFKGYGYTPEGPPGVDNNYPPGYKEGSDKYGQYEKTEDIENNEIGESKTKSKRMPYIFKKISVAVWVDGKWNKLTDKDGTLLLNNDMTIKREYIPRSTEEIKSYEEIVKGCMGYDQARKDLVVVKNIQFNWEDKWLKEDLTQQRKIQLKKTLIWALITLFVLFLGTIIYRAVVRELARRRRINEEELAMQQQLLREQAMKAAEEQGIEVELSLEERARLEMQQNAINLAKEKPQDVAALLRTWLSEE